MVPFPLDVTVKSGWVICSRIQIELLSKTVDSSIDWASCGLLKTRLPPRTGPVLAVPPPEPELDPQPASRARAEPKMNALVRAVRCLTSCSRGVFPGGGKPPRWRRTRMGVYEGYSPV